MARWIKYALLSLLVLFLCAIPLAMQFETGSIEGTVGDDFGPVAYASVEANHMMTGAFSHTESDPAGNYKLENLHPGRYALWVQAQGHDSLWLREVIVERGRATHQDLMLKRSPRIPTER